MTSNPNRLSALNTHWNNRSLSSMTSDAPTFHSAHAHVELPRVGSSNSSLNPAPQPLSPTGTSQPHSPPMTRTAPTSISQTTESTHMARQDSGFSDGIPSGSTNSSRRTSTSSTSHRSKPKRTPSSTHRPSAKRAARSSPTTIQLRSSISTSSKRPPLPSSRHTTPHGSPYQYYQFPTLPQGTTPSHDPSLSHPIDPEQENTIQHPQSPQPPPPPTCQYWTSHSTRRLEYAAIDAASKGVRGFFIKLVPDCILPPRARRTKFHGEEEDSDAGSVRRYRIPLPEEKDTSTAVSKERRPGLFTRLSNFGRSS